VAAPPTVDIRRAATRPHTELGWLDSRHSFSFGQRYDPANTHFGLLLVSNDDRVRPSSGFGAHSHRDMEIVTWVLSGELEHHDSEGNRGVIQPGLVQRMSAGTGITHSETNPSATDEVHFVQMWVPPDTNGLPPGYEQRDVSEVLAAGGLHVVASGQGHDGAVTIHQRDAALSAGRLAPGETAAVPAAPHVHLFVAAGDAWLDEEGLLVEGDAARIRGSAGFDVTSGAGGAELLVWATA
jgi:redox-sensitive bicupin YhaK (pirin superfamily)